LPAEIAGADEVLDVQVLGALGATGIDVPIDGLEHGRKRPAVADAHAALVADLKDALQLEFEIAGIPVARIGGTDRGRAGRAARQLGHSSLRSSAGRTVASPLDSSPTISNAA
jgi:hypothetical protein